MPVFKVVWLCQFNKNMTPEEGRKHWLEVHAPIALRVPGLKGYTQNHCVQPVGAQTITDQRLAFDGYAELWWEDKASYEAAMSSREWAALNEDGALVFEIHTLVGAVLDEHVVRRLPS